MVYVIIEFHWDLDNVCFSFLGCLDHVCCRECRRNVDRVSVDISLTHLDRISVICRRYISQLSVICRSTVGGISVNYRSHISRMSYVSANYWPIHRSSIGQLSAKCRPSVGQVSARYR